MKPVGRLIGAIAIAGLSVGAASGVASAGGPPGYNEDTASYTAEAVGTGEFIDTIVGFRATGPTLAQAAANVIAACTAAGGQECTSDEETNDNVCIVSVADDTTDVVAGGSGPTVDAARNDALARAAANNTPMAPNSPVIISACP